MKKSLIFCAALELFGIGVIGAGLAYETIYEADIGFFIITGGSCIVAIGGVLWGKIFRGMM